jgi:hypothetical protein
MTDSGWPFLNRAASTLLEASAVMKTIQWLTSALLVSAMAMPCAMAQGVHTGGGAANLPSQRIVNEAPEGTGAVLTLSPATVRRVQQELNRLGYNAGPVSGSWDRMTSMAATDFQRAHGLSPVGTLDETTMRMLGVGLGGGEIAGAGRYPGMNGAYGGNRGNTNPNTPGSGLSAGNISGANGSGNGAVGPGGSVNSNSGIINGKSGSTDAATAPSGAGTASGAAGTATSGTAPER